MKRIYFRFVGSLAVLFLSGTISTSIRAGQPAKVDTASLHSLTFSRVVLRLKDETDINIAPDEYRVRFLEDLRKRGYPARGAESLVFGQDDSDEARFVLGATITDLQCVKLPDSVRKCEATAQWELLDRDSKSVVYRVVTRHMAEAKKPHEMGEALVWGIYRSLLKRARFVSALTKNTSVESAPQYPMARARKCEAPERPMPKSSPAVLDSTVIVHSGQRLGSGTLISPDGYVLTAAHVLAPSEDVVVQRKDGRKENATAVRINHKMDVALLRLPKGDYPCLAPRTDEMVVGADIYAVGSPLGKELSFSVSRGIMSGFRTIDGVRLVQTDASINRGNSGGPLVDGEGRFVGVVSWKVAGEGVEGIAFAIPTSAALDAIGVSMAEETAGALANASPIAAAPPVALVVDDEDSSELFRPAGPDIAYESLHDDHWAAPRESNDTGAQKVGYVLAVAGGIGATAWVASGTDDATMNGVGIVSLGVLASGILTIAMAGSDGAASTPNKAAASSNVRVSAGIGLNSAAVRFTY